MPVLIRRLLYRIAHTITWREMLILLLVHFASSWYLMATFDAGQEYTGLPTYWWFYVVTVTTVGYGDFSPASAAARAVAAFYVMPIGIAFMGAVIGKIAAFFVEMAEKVRGGLMELHCDGHTVVVGDGKQQTLELLRNLIADSHQGDVVLVSSRAERPDVEGLDGFVSGEIDDELVQARACLATAATVIVLADSDVEAVGRAISVVDGTKETTRVVVFFRSRSTADRYNKQSEERVHYVVSVDMSAVVQEAQDPGAADFVSRLLDNQADETYMRMTVPEGCVIMSFLELANKLMQHRINPFGIYDENGKVVICPDPNTKLKPGTVLAVAANDRRQLQDFVWS